MKTRARTLLASSLVLGVLAGPATVPVHAATGPAAVAAVGGVTTADVATVGDAGSRALTAAIAGLPREDATAALVRVGGTEGTWRGSAGVHDVASGRPADPGARFRAGSVTKVFTAATALQLAAERKLSLGRTVRSYLPGLVPAAYAGVTVGQLLNHTSGIPAADMPGGTVEEWYAHRFDPHTPQEMVASATAKEPEFAPGRSQHYLNINYTLLGLLIEKVTGDRYAHQVAVRILRPLGLDSTYFPEGEARIRGPHNHGYQLFPAADGTSEWRDVSVWGTADAWAAGDIVTTTADLERFTRALFQGRVVRGPLLEQMFTLPEHSVRMYGSGDPAQYSAGLSVMTLGGREVWGKTGGRYGYNTAIAATRDLSRTLVYSVNSTDAKGEDLNPTALNIIIAAYGAPSAP
ncbi:serine hydrolase domain-containing protein [Streptomyces sp. NPDC001770]